MNHPRGGVRLRPHFRNSLSIAVGLLLTGAPALAQNVPPLPDGAEMLDRTVVTAAGFEQAVREAPASITVITRDELESKPFHGLAEALGDIEGVDVDQAWDKTGAPSISIRGMPADYTLILIDGRRQNASGNVTPNNFGGTANNFMPPMSAIERIEVIRGPMSTLYGSDAMGGVVNIITRKVGGSWGGSVGIDTTLQDDSRFGDTHSANVYLSGPLRRDLLGLTVWGSTFRRGAADIRYLDLEGEEIVPWMAGSPVRYDNDNLGARVDLQASDVHELWLEASVNEQRYDNSGGQVGTLGNGGYAEEQRYEREQVSLSWTARFDAGTLDSSLMRNTTETIGRLIPPGLDGAGGARELESQNTVFDTKFVTGIGDHMLSVGGQHWDAEMVDGVAPGNFEFTQWAVFAEDEWSLTDRLNLTGGVRRDDHSTFGGQTSPRLYLVFNASDEWLFKGGVSRGFKTPRVEQLTPGINGFGGQGTIPLIGSPDLVPETSTNAELSASYANAAGHSYSVGLFHNEFDDKIARGVPVPNCSFAASPDRPGCVDVGNWPNVDTFGQSINIDEAVTRGVEAAARVPLADAFTLSTNATWTDSEQKTGSAAGEPLVNTPDLMANATLDWQLNDAVNLYWRSQYRGSRYRGAGLAQDQLGDYKPYTVHHLGGTWNLREGVSLNAALYNLFDKDFIDYTPYVSNANSGAISYSNRYVNNEDGRRLWLSLNVEF